MNKKRAFVFALAAVMGLGGIAETTPRASATERMPAPTTSIDAVRGDALARMSAGDIQTVRGGGWRGNRGYRGGRDWGGRRGYYGRNRYYGGNRYYGRRDYYDRRHHRRNRGRNIAIGVGAAALAIGAIAAANQNNGYRGSSWCARRYRTYDARSGTYIASPGVRRACP